MLSKGFKIVNPKTFEVYMQEVVTNSDEAIVKIDKLAICKADLRYYLGDRDLRTLGLKYPMRLIHEGIGTIVKDTSGKFSVGDKVVLVPNLVKCNDEGCTACNDSNIGENYCDKAVFASSNADGFSCEYMSYPTKNLLNISNLDNDVAVFAELTSVAMAAIRRVKNINNKVIAIWGDGIVGYILTCVLRIISDSRLICIGKHKDKLELFDADEIYLVNDDELKQLEVDIAFECVGGKGAENAINEMFNCIKIGGEIILTGVSEYPLHISTRKILEKAIRITGSTRSNIEDFKESLRLMENELFSQKLKLLIIKLIEIKNISDYYQAFENEHSNKSLGKCILKFNI